VSRKPGLAVAVAIPFAIIAVILIFAIGPESTRIITAFLFVAGMAFALVRPLLARLRRWAVTSPPSTVDEPKEPAAPRERRYFVPSELPASPKFVGREQQLDDAVAAIKGPGPSVLLVCGEPGIGKTAFAVQAAHRAASSFSDGALYADLSVESGDVVTNVLGDFVVSLQADGAVPQGLDERLNRYRYLTGVERGQVLVLLDDAHDAEQVRTLLPAGEEGAVIVTARQRLDIGATHVVELKALTLDEATELLRTLIGSDRVDKEVTAARTIVTRSERYPIALQLAASSMSSRRNGSLQAAVDAMGEPANGSTSPQERALDFTFALMTADERDTLLLIGLLPEETFTAWMVSAMLGGLRGTEPDETLARRLCDRLVDLRLLENLPSDSTAVSTFRVLDHVRNYAKARVEREWTEENEATRGNKQRALDALAEEGRRRAKPDLPAILETTVYQPLAAGELADALTGARLTLDRAREELAAARAELGARKTKNKDARDRLTRAREGHNLALAALAEVQAELGAVEDALECAGRALVQSERTPLATPRALRIRGKLERRQRHHAAAVATLTEALDLAANLGRDGTEEQARIRRELAVAHSAAGHSEQAMATIQQAIDALPDEPSDTSLPASLYWARAVVCWEAVRNSAGDSSRRRNDLATADRDLITSLRFARSAGLLLWRAWAGLERAEVKRAQGEHDLGRVLAFRALEGFAEMRHRYGTARCRLEIGQSYLDQRRPEDALPVLEEARETFATGGDRELGRAARDALHRARDMVVAQVAAAGSRVGFDRTPTPA